MENINLNSDESCNSLLDDDDLSDIALSGLSYQLSSPSEELSLMEKKEDVEPEVDSSVTDVYQEALARKVQRDTQLTWIYILLSVSVLFSWFLGEMDFSLAWVFLLLLLIGVVWHGNFARLVDEAVVFEQIRVNRRRALHSEESAEWLNFIINRWWIFSSSTLFTIAKNALDPLLNDSKPAFIESMELQEFTLGDSTPTIHRIKAFDVTNGRKPLAKSAFELAERRSCQLAIELDVALHCPDYRMLLKARLGGKGVGMDLDIAMEKLNLSGKLNVLLSLNMESAFPHITKATFSFIEKPEVWFNLRILKTVQMMEVPVLKTWLHSFVMDCLTTALVNPGKLEVNLDVMDSYVPSQESRNLQAQGVLTVTLSRQQSNNKVLAALNEEERWCVIHLGEQKQVTAKRSTSVRWQECRSFLVENVTSDKLCIKLKTKRLISTITLAQYDLPLSAYNFEANRLVETVLQKKGPKSILNTTNINLRMEYTPLAPIRLDLNPKEAKTNGEAAGVMYVCIHGAEDLVAPDKRGSLNPYCIVFCNRKKVKTSHYIRQTTNPKWESSVEFLVADYLQMVISFAICNFDTSKSVDSDLLGIGSVALVSNESMVVKKQIPLSFNVSPESNYGSITVSAVFRPVASVAESDQSQLQCPSSNCTEDDDSDFMRVKKNSSSFMQTAKMFLSNTPNRESVDLADILSSGSGLMELTVVRARDLVAKDLNGFSDPYCEVKKNNNDCVFKTTIKKKTLNPEWDESVTLQLPKIGETIAVIVWDRDPLGMRDFLGSVVLSLDDIRQISAKNSSEWFTLKDTKTGEIELRLKVISEDFELEEPDKAIAVASGIANDEEQIMDSPLTPPIIASCFETPATKPPLPKMSPAATRKLPLAVPSPIPPRKGSQLSVNGSQGSQGTPADRDGSITQTSTPRPEAEELNFDHIQTSSASITPPSSPTMAVEGEAQPVKSPVRSEVSPTESIGSKKSGLRSTPEYSSIRAMKQKVKYGLTHPLRRFRSEASVHEPKTKSMRDRVTVETREPGMQGTDFDSLVQATSHPDISQLIPTSLEQKLSTPAKETKTRYFNIQGRIIQGLGFQASQQNLIYCRVRLHRSFERSSRSSSGKTICKSSLIPSSLNPRFDTEFQIDSSSGVLKSAILVFDIRTDKKETIATKTLVLREVLEDNSAETHSVQDWFVLSNGAKLEIEISHGKPIEKKSSKLFRSWSVHRIGKI